MQELFVYLSTAVAVFLVICGFRKRKRVAGQNAQNTNAGIYFDGMYVNHAHESIDIEQFKIKMSIAGFRDETIEDMFRKIVESKGFVSLSDAEDIINALAPVMRIKKDS